MMRRGNCLQRRVKNIGKYEEKTDRYGNQRSSRDDEHKIQIGYKLQIESRDAEVNNLDSALPDYMWDKEAKEQFQKQKDRKLQFQNKNQFLSSGNNEKLEESKKPE